MGEGGRKFSKSEFCVAASSALQSQNTCFMFLAPGISVEAKNTVIFKSEPA